MYPEKSLQEIQALITEWYPPPPAPSPLKEPRSFFPRSFLLRTRESSNRCRLFLLVTENHIT